MDRLPKRIKKKSPGGIHNGYTQKKQPTRPNDLSEIWGGLPKLQPPK